MFDIKKDIQAMTTFRRNPRELVKHVKKTKRPLILTVNGRAEAVVQDAEAYPHSARRQARTFGKVRRLPGRLPLSASRKTTPHFHPTTRLS